MVQISWMQVRLQVWLRQCSVECRDIVAAQMVIVFPKRRDSPSFQAETQSKGVPFHPTVRQLSFPSTVHEPPHANLFTIKLAQRHSDKPKSGEEGSPLPHVLPARRDHALYAGRQEVDLHV